MIPTCSCCARIAACQMDPKLGDRLRDRCGTAAPAPWPAPATWCEREAANLKKHWPMTTCSQAHCPLPSSPMRASARCGAGAGGRRPQPATTATTQAPSRRPWPWAAWSTFLSKQVRCPGRQRSTPRRPKLNQGLINAQPAFAGAGAMTSAYKPRSSSRTGNAGQGGPQPWWPAGRMGRPAGEANS